MESSISPELMQHIEKFWGVDEEVVRELEEKGIHQTPMPTYRCPHLTAKEVVNLNDKDFAIQYAQTNEWTSFTKELVAEIEAKIQETNRMMDQVEALLREVAIPKLQIELGHKPSVQEIKDRIGVDPFHLRVSRYQTRLAIKLGRVTAKSKTFSADMSMLSRNVEIRRQEKEQFRVENNIPVRGFDPKSRP
jgi:hypothetical protein